MPPVARWCHHRSRGGPRPPPSAGRSAHTRRRRTVPRGPQARRAPRRGSLPSSICRRHPSRRRRRSRSRRQVTPAPSGRSCPGSTPTTTPRGRRPRAPRGRRQRSRTRVARRAHRARARREPPRPPRRRRRRSRGRARRRRLRGRGPGPFAAARVPPRRSYPFDEAVVNKDSVRYAAPMTTQAVDRMSIRERHRVGRTPRRTTAVVDSPSRRTRRVAVAPGRVCKARWLPRSSVVCTGSSSMAVTTSPPTGT